ncbi:uncharacterized protein F5Z01DRAFT_150827 [Emericellopsis atlantica]|uniref:Uncharacterized protein n=1 Tax=Emericellopsis atlantica TaxID=2614577 RepID=A0A9P7ZL69_9HYPO|nr:uncharacterized protein F5Z01DRAFT_150827 [Emericellopsis atlantica]KAG9253625.1 hypothetical protein F5Z01DRAFT_150827 [Emericellopsis atlantica]
MHSSEPQPPFIGLASEIHPRNSKSEAQWDLGMHGWQGCGWHLLSSISHKRLPFTGDFLTRQLVHRPEKWADCESPSVPSLGSAFSTRRPAPPVLPFPTRHCATVPAAAVWPGATRSRLNRTKAWTCPSSTIIQSVSSLACSASPPPAAQRDSHRSALERSREPFTVSIWQSLVPPNHNSIPPPCPRIRWLPFRPGRLDSSSSPYCPSVPLSLNQS